MLAHKAQRFADATRYQQIMTSSDPVEQKDLERAVSGFNADEWDTNHLEIAHQANLYKFGQNLNLDRFLLGTGNKTPAEASHTTLYEA